MTPIGHRQGHGASWAKAPGGALAIGARAWKRAAARKKLQGFQWNPCLSCMAERCKCFVVLLRLTFWPRFCEFRFTSRLQDLVFITKKQIFSLDFRFFTAKTCFPMISVCFCYEEYIFSFGFSCFIAKKRRFTINFGVFSLLKTVFSTQQHLHSCGPQVSSNPRVLVQLTGPWQNMFKYCLSTQFDYHILNHIEILCTYPRRIARDVFSRPGILRNFWKMCVCVCSCVCVCACLLVCSFVCLFCATVDPSHL